MRNVVGIDISKSSSEVAILCNSKVKQQFKITNDALGFIQLEHELKSLNPFPEIVFEATGIYSRRLKAFLEDHNYRYCQLNPLVAKKELDQLRPNKNDINDALGLAKSQYLLNRANTFVQNPTYKELLLLSRFYQQLTRDIVVAKNRLHRALQVTFPEIERLLSTTDGDTYWCLVEQFPHAKIIQGHSFNTLVNSVSSTIPHNISLERAEKITRKLVTLASISYPAVAFTSDLIYQVRHWANQLSSLTIEKNKTIRKMVSLAKNLPEYDILMSIPGFAETTVVSLIGELGDIRRFKTPNQINAFIGIDLRFNDSGNYKSAGCITKRGDAIARKILFKVIGNMATSAYYGHQSHINDWYQNKKRSNPSRGMKKITIGAMDRLISTIHHLVNTNQFYDYDIASKHTHSQI